MPVRRARGVRIMPPRAAAGASPFLPRLAAMVAALFLCAGALAPPARAQGTWVQTEFVIGTGNDPLATPDLAETRRSLRFAKNAYFNLLTGTVAHTDDDHWRVFLRDPALDEARLGAAAELGLKVFMSNNAYSGALATDVPPAIEEWDASLARSVLDGYAETTSDADCDSAMWGYFLFDEPGPHPNTEAWVKAWIDSIHDDDKRFGGNHHRAAFLNFSPGDAATMNAIANDPNPDKRLDVASLDLYPFGPESGKPCPNQRWGYFTGQAQLKAAMGTRPYWVLTVAAPAIFEGASVYFCDPDANQLRYMAFGAAAAGAKGIIWMGYRPSPEYDSIPNPSYPLVDVERPGCKYYTLKTINHYLHDVVGPVVMANEHAGLFHEANGPRPEPPEYMPLVAGAPPAACPVTDLGNDNLAVGVFRPPNSAGEYYLLVMNKALAPQAATVQLRASYAIAAAPSVVGYVGGGFSPVGAGSSFPVSLEGGEGRLFHLTASPAGHVALSSPAGGEQWLPGEAHTVAWSPASAAVDIDLYADLFDAGAGLDGPVIRLATGATGGSFSFTMPDVTSHAARIVIRANGAVTHRAPLRTVAAPAGASSSWLLGDGECAMNGTLAIGPSGRPTAAYQTALARLEYRTFTGTAWGAPVEASVRPDHEDWIDGYFAALAIDSNGDTHVAALSGAVQSPARSRELLHYFRPALAESVERVSGLAGASSFDIATTADGGLVVAGADSAALRVMHKAPGGWENWGTAFAHPGIRNVALAVDASDNAWVALTLGGAGGQDEIAVFKVTPTASTQVLAGMGCSGRVSLALDPTGKPCLAFTFSSPNGGDVLGYRAYDGASWGPTETIDASLGTVTSLALALNGPTPGIAYVGNHVAKQATRSGASWVRETLAATDAEGPIRLAYSPATGERWAMFYDREQDAMRVVAGPARPGAVCEGCPPAAGPSIALRSEHPLRIGRALAFELRLPGAAALAMALYDVAGRRVAARPLQRLAAGEHRVQWTPNALRPGAYFLRVTRDGEPLLDRRLVLLR